MVSHVSHPAKELLAVNLVNGEVVFLKKLIKLRAHQFDIDVGHPFLAHDQPLILRQPAQGFPRIVIPHVEPPCRCSTPVQTSYTVGAYETYHGGLPGVDLRAEKIKTNEAIQ